MGEDGKNARHPIGLILRYNMCQCMYGRSSRADLKSKECLFDLYSRFVRGPNLLAIMLREAVNNNSEAYMRVAEAVIAYTGSKSKQTMN